jgi:uncharacterized membrane protein
MPAANGVETLLRALSRGAYHRPLLGVVVAIAAGLRIYHIGAQSLWIDELEEGHTARAAIPELLQYVRQDAGGAPLDYLGVKLTTSLFGAGTVGTRLWALLLGCTAVVLVYFVATAWFKRPVVGLVSAFLLALSGFHLYYSIEARPYALSVAAALLQLWLFHRAIERDRWRDWLAFGALAGVVLYAHYFLAVLLVAEGVGLFVVRLWGAAGARWHREQVLGAVSQLLRFAAAACIAAALFAPWIWFASLTQLHDLGWPVLPRLTPARVYTILGTLLALGPLGQAAAPASALGPLDPRQTLMLWSVLAMAAAGIYWELAERRLNVLVLVLVPAIAIPAAWIADQRQHYFWSERQVIFVLPCLYLLCAAGVVGTARWLLRLIGRDRDLRQAMPAIAGAVAVAIVAWTALSWHSIHAVYLDRWIAKENWRQASAFAAQHTKSDTLVYSFLPDMFAYGVAYYQPQLEARGRWTPMDSQTAARTVASLDLHPDDLVVTAASYVADGSAADELLRSKGFTPRDFPGQIRVYSAG